MTDVLKLPVSQGKLKNLHERMEALCLREEDVEEYFYQGKYQGIGTRGVTLLHKPTGLRVKTHRERSQGINRFLARRMLVEELEARSDNKTRQEVKAEKIHRAKKKKKTARAKKIGILDLAALEKGFQMRPLHHGVNEETN